MMPSLSKIGKFATAEDELRRYLGLLLEIALQHTTTFLKAQDYARIGSYCFLSHAK